MIFDKNDINDNTDKDDFGSITSTLKDNSLIHRIYLSDSVKEFDAYHKLLVVLDQANIRDEVIITMQNYGGDCHSCLALVNSIAESKATVTFRVLAPCYSAASTLALSGANLDLHPGTLLMFHDWSGSLTGAGHKMTQELEHSNKWIHDYMRRIHRPFLTKKECDHIESGKTPELYIYADDKDIQERLNRHFKRKQRGK